MSTYFLDHLTAAAFGVAQQMLHDPTAYSGELSPSIEKNASESPYTEEMYRTVANATGLPIAQIKDIHNSYLNGHIDRYGRKHWGLYTYNNKIEAEGQNSKTVMPGTGATADRLAFQLRRYNSKMAEQYPWLTMLHPGMQGVDNNGRPIVVREQQQRARAAELARKQSCPSDNVQDIGGTNPGSTPYHRVWNIRQK